MRQRKSKSRVTQLRGDESGRESAPIDPVRARERTMQRAAKLLAVKPRSVEELREKLLEREQASEEIVDAVLAQLKEYQYLNDERFAFGFASYQVRQKPIGRRRLQRALDLKKVDRATANQAIDLVLEEMPEDDLIDRAVAKRIRLRGRPKTRAESKSLFDHLLRLGFPFELVIRKVRAASTAEIDEDEAP